MDGIFFTGVLGFTGAGQGKAIFVALDLLYKRRLDCHKVRVRLLQKASSPQERVPFLL